LYTLQPLYPFASRVADKFNERILQLPKETRELVEKFLPTLLKTNANWYLYDELIRWLDRNSYILFKDAERMGQNTFFQHDFSIKKCVTGCD
jgi:hypothetical protein